MKVVIDTSAYSAYNRGDTRLSEFFDPQNELIIPLIVVAELRAGFALGAKERENEALLQRLLASPSVATVTVTDVTTKLFAGIFQNLKTAGTPISTNDIWIAAIALEHDAIVATLDADFMRVPDLMVGKIQQPRL